MTAPPVFVVWHRGRRLELTDRQLRELAVRLLVERELARLGEHLSAAAARDRIGGNH